MLMFSPLSIATAQKLSEIHKHLSFSVDTTGSQDSSSSSRDWSPWFHMYVADLQNTMRSKHSGGAALHVLVCAALSRQGHIRGFQ
jgi:hypothetical protein